MNNMYVIFLSLRGLGFINSPPYTPDESTVAKSKCLIFQVLSRQSKCIPPSGEDIEKYFYQFGKVTAFKKNASNGYVVFNDIKQAQRALDISNHIVKGCKIKLIPAVRDLSASSPIKNNVPPPIIQKSNSGVVYFQAPLKSSQVDFPSINDIRQHFKQYGEVVNVMMQSHSMGKVIFRTVKEAEKALATPEHLIRGYKFQLLPCTSGNRALRQTAESNTSNSKCVFFEILNKESKVPIPSNHALLEHFQRYGKIESFSRNNNQGVGYITFETSEGAYKALSVSEHFVNGCKLRVTIEKEDPFKKSVQNKSPLIKEENGNDARRQHGILKCQAYPNKSNAPCPPPESIVRYFLIFGRLLTFQWHPQSCSGTLTFHSAESARIALSIPEHMVDGCIIRLLSCKRSLRRRGSNKRRGSRNTKRLRVQCRCLDYQLLLRLSNCKPPSKRDLEDYFSRFGFVETLRQHRSDPNGCVVYRTLEEAKNAYSVTEHKAGNCLIKLIPKKSIPDFCKSDIYK
ncbi:unnamed protein product [Hymenolepis diminuta]|uniref:RRM domain-containing protein n=1 Tax=Hymenolepis diminuta TaxID=6216 RepID=A0A564YE02_HYMDI|nr:unnamed protein product [Hymenolepis diminuta]